MKQTLIDVPNTVQQATDPECTPGFANKYGGSCSKCSTGETSDGGTRQSCYCMPGTIGSYLCQKCSDGTISNKGDSQCTSCTSGQLSDPLNQKCITTDECTKIQGSTQTNNSCKCSNLLSLDKKSCVGTCGENEVAFSLSYDRQYCGCNLGFILNAMNSSCIDQSECKESDGFSIQNYKCVCNDTSKVPVLGQNGIQCMNLQPGWQECDKNQYFDNTQCQSCPTGSTSPGGYVLQCVCPDGKNMVNNVCVDLSCTTSQYAYKNQCKNCPEGSKSSGGTGDSCDCTPGFYFDPKKGQCQQCQEKYTSSGGIGATCTCAPGTYLSGSSCIQCSSGYVSAANVTSCTSCSGNKNFTSPTQTSCISQDECQAISGAIANASFFYSTCTCNGKALNFKGDACVEPADCGGNTTTLKTGTITGGSYGSSDVLTCICENGYILNAAQSGCEKADDCNSARNMTVNDYKCQCTEAGAIGVVQDGQVICTKNAPQPVQCNVNQYLVAEQCKDCPENSSSEGGRVTSCTCNSGYAPMNNNVCTALNCTTSQKVDGNQCVRCPTNSHSSGGQSTTCSCDSGYEDKNNNGTCTRIICEQNYYFNTTDQVCKQCPEHSTQNRGSQYQQYTTCNCDPTYTPAQTTEQCTPLNCNTTQYAANNTCKDCPANSTSQGGQGTTCSCSPGYKFQNSYGSGSCNLCSAGETSAGGYVDQCTCSGGTYSTPSSFDKCTVCSTNTTSVPGGQCSPCDSGKMSDPLRQKCISIDDCARIEGATTSAGCTCAGKPLSLNGTACVSSCGSNQTQAYIYQSYSSTGSIAQCICQNSYIKDPIGSSCFSPADCTSLDGFKVDNYKCVCSNPALVPFKNDDGTFSCVAGESCSENQYFNGTSCQSCPANSTSPGGSVQECTCNPGFGPMQNGVCPLLNCSTTQKVQGNQCVACQANAHSNGGQDTQCQCNTGYEDPNNSGRCTQIRCSTNQFLNVTSNKCQACPEHSTQYSGQYKTCKCQAGYEPAETTDKCTLLNCNKTQYVSINECKDCPEGSVSNGGQATTCSCNPGYYFDVYQGEGSCKLCDSGKTSDGGVDVTCYCSAGTQKFDLLDSCTGCQGNQYSEKGKNCTQCPPGTITDILHQNCITEAQCMQIDRAYVNQSSNCVCQDSAFSLSRKGCYKCGINETQVTIANSPQQINYCICKNGYATDPSGSSCLLIADCLSENGLIVENYTCKCQNSSQVPQKDENNVFICLDVPGGSGCPKDQYLDHNVCKKCPANSESAGGFDQTCDCKPGFKKDDQDQCVSAECPTNQYYNMNTQQCTQCPQNSTSMGGTSTTCDCGAGSIFSNGNCVSENANTASPLVSVLLVALVVVLCTMAVTLLLALRKRRGSLSMAASVPFSIAGAL